MGHWIKFLFIFLSFSLISCGEIEARSGCCSHHDGVCGCRCCDGSPLSAKCAPYYPSCNSRVVTQPTSTPRPITIPTKKPTITPTKINILTNTPVFKITNTPTKTLASTTTSIPTAKITEIEEISPTTVTQVLGEIDSNNPPVPAKTSDVLIGLGIFGVMGFGIYKIIKKIVIKLKSIISDRSK